MSMPLPTADSRGVIPLRLPDLPDDGQPGSRFVRRAVSLTLLTLAALAGAAVLVASLVKMDVTVKAAGVLEPIRLYPVRAMEGGLIRDVLVQTGDTVRAGQPLVRLDSLEIAAQLAQLEAQYRATAIDRDRSATAEPLQRAQSSERAAQAATHLAAALATLRQRMVEYDLGTNVDSLLAAYTPGHHVVIDQAVAEVRGAQAETRLSGADQGMQGLARFDREKLDAQMQQLQAQISALRVRLGRLTLAAPTAGVVLTEQMERLQGSVVREGDALVDVADLRDWRVLLTVTERDVHRIQLGDSVKVELPAFEQTERRQLGGRVVYLAPEPVGAASPAAASALTTTQGTPAQGPAQAQGGYRVIASLDRAQLERMGLAKFRRGYSVQANVITRRGRIITLLWNYVTERLGA